MSKMNKNGAYGDEGYYQYPDPDEIPMTGPYFDADSRREYALQLERDRAAAAAQMAIHAPVGLRRPTHQTSAETNVNVNVVPRASPYAQPQGPPVPNSAYESPYLVGRNNPGQLVFQPAQHQGPGFLNSIDNQSLVDINSQPAVTEPRRQIHMPRLPGNPGPNPAYNSPYPPPQNTQPQAVPGPIRTHRVPAVARTSKPRKRIMRTHRPSNDQCPHCAENVFDNDEHWQSHIDDHEYPWTCKERRCRGNNAVFEAERNLRQHMNEQHGPQAAAKLKWSKRCPVCLEHFNRETLFDKHMREQHPGFQ